MTTTTTPLYEITLFGQRLRFFRPQMGEPDWPWVSIEDLFTCLGADPQLSKNILEDDDFDEAISNLTIATPDGPLAVVPGWHGGILGFIDWLVEEGIAPPDCKLAYSKELFEAIGTLHPEFPRDPALGCKVPDDWIKAVCRRWNLQPPQR